MRHPISIHERPRGTAVSPAEEDIVALAYAMAVGSERFYELFAALEARFETAAGRIEDGSEVDALVAPTFSPLEPHFENALSLMHAAATRREKPMHSVRAMEDDMRPHMLITPKAWVIYANDAAINQFDVTPGKLLCRTYFEASQHENFVQALGTLGQAADHQLIATVSLQRPDGGGTTRVGLRRINGDKCETLGQISALSTSWRPDLAAEFKSAMKITPVELEIVRAIVTGVSLSDLAAKRDRAVGTVRLQAKNLLSKLQLRSQTELACLYASFAELRTNGRADTAEDCDSLTASHLLKLADGRILEYQVAGPSGGRPVLFFPALLGGNALTPQMRQRLFSANVRLIMVWRPGFAQSDVNGPATFESFAKHATDIEVLLNTLGVRACPVVGHITSVMFAYALACYAPNRVEKIIAVNGTVPSRSGSHVSHLDKSERLRFMLLRRPPKLGACWCMLYWQKLMRDLMKSF